MLSRTLLFCPSICKIEYYILLVDDIASIRKVYIRYLKEQDRLLPIECSNGKEAVDTYLEKHGQIVAIIMDMQMPVLNGADATKQIRESEENGIDPPYIVGLSGEELSGDKGLQRYFDEFCIKPISKQKFQ